MQPFQPFKSIIVAIEPIPSDLINILYGFMTLNTQQIWQDYSARLRAFLISRLSDPDDAEDLLQDILLSVHQKLPTLQSKDKLKSWLFQIAHNRIVDFYRDQQKASRIGQDKFWYERMSYDDTHVLEACVEPFIDSLSPNSRALLMAIDLKDTSQKEYAAQVNLPYSTLKSQVKKARNELRKIFEDCCALAIDGQGNIFKAIPKSKKCDDC